ncbi:MAG TPA: hypothetical protein VNO52_11585 [Methylomirabilota bacterium]|nr:hypothetical protein [Methylomirabilota bacterium]
MRIRLTSPPACRARGHVLFQTMVYSGILGIACYALLQMSEIRVRSSHQRWDYNEAFYHAENALNWGVQRLADVASPNGNFKLTDGTLALDYFRTLTNGGASYLEDVWLTITNHPSGVANLFLLSASAKVGNKVRTLQVAVQRDPPSQVFDYEYFLNNWGWWWGSSITGNGDNRANWDFDFRDRPTVNGSVIATGDIESNGTPIDPLSGTVPLAGLAGSDPVAYVHDGTPRLPMPNLKNFSDYASLAIRKGGTLHLGTNLLVNAVHTNLLTPGMYLVGTTSAPVVINGPVVIPGDVVLKGVISGIGTLYVGGNLYVAGNVTYLNGPDFSTPPELMTGANRDRWVRDNVAAGKDLVAFAVRESVFGGDVTSTEWINRCYNPSGYGLRWVGAERNLGADGIPGTPDDGLLYLDTTGDGRPDSAWYDADGDGMVDVAYNYGQDIEMTASRAMRILGFPRDGLGAPAAYGTLASNNFNRLDGVFYCNHAIAIRSTRSGFVANGALICRDEAIVFTGNLKFNYDSRIHSRYSGDPNRFVDLGLPVANKVSITSMVEAAPVAGFYSGVYSGSRYGHMGVAH